MAGSIEMTIILKLCGTERSCLLHGEVLNKALKSGIIHGFRSCKALYTYLTSLVFFRFEEERTRKLNVFFKIRITKDARSQVLELLQWV